MHANFHDMEFSAYFGTGYPFSLYFSGGTTSVTSLAGSSNPGSVFHSGGLALIPPVTQQGQHLSGSTPAITPKGTLFDLGSVTASQSLEPHGPTGVPVTALAGLVAHPMLHLLGEGGAVRPRHCRSVDEPHPWRPVVPPPNQHLRVAAACVAPDMFEVGEHLTPQSLSAPLVTVTAPLAHAHRFALPSWFTLEILSFVAALALSLMYSPDTTQSLQKQFRAIRGSP
eukprot:CAMPEP_0169483464 /NCGR_PEP_ID=MMETSP1042-20121227/31231_1 /TAXON_ID=464988 /ORGANISM="Hemiselmis andersenii, Strain CCMP1180" /LENGTH=225 /DNA_ID=CAMNT_0009598417 /DNA_START=81 /DNA_END=760 /DNA_ORIENTATION=+